MPANGATPRSFHGRSGGSPPYQSEGRIYAKYLLKEKPDARIAVLYQNDDFGKDLLTGLRDGLGEKASMIVAEDSYEVSEPTIESHIVKLKSTAADVFLSITTPKFAAQAIRKAAELGWKPLYLQINAGASIDGVIQPAGLDNAQGILSAAYAKDGADSRWDEDAGMQEFSAFLREYAPDANKADSSVVYGYGAAQTMVKVLQQCGDNLTRENVMRQAAGLKDFAPDTLLPGIKINTNAADFFPIEQLQMMRFQGAKWELFGEVISTEFNK